VQAWVQKNLAPQPSTEEFESLESLTQRCIHEAQAAGISEEEIADELGDLKALIKEALDSAAASGRDEEPPG